MVLRQFRPFVRLFQVCGIIPFSVYGNEQSLLKFTFSVRHPVFWWFVLALAWQVACPLTPVFFKSSYLKEKSNRYDKIPTEVVVFMTMSIIIWYFILISLRWSSLQFKRLKRVLASLVHIEEIMCRYKDKSSPPTFNSKTALGAAIVFVLSILGTIASYPAYPLIAELFGSKMAFAIVFNYFTLLLSVGFLILFFHAMYLMVGLHIKEIRLCLCQSSAPNISNVKHHVLPTSDHGLAGVGAISNRFNAKVLGFHTMPLHEGQICFNYACKAASELHAAFSFTSFVILAIEFIGTVINLYILIASFIQPSDFTQMRQLNMIFNFMTGMLIITSGPVQPSAADYSLQ